MTGLVACAGLLAVGYSGARAPARASDPNRLVLHLSDLPPGYAVGDGGCGVDLADEGATEALRQLARQTPLGCNRSFVYDWGSSRIEPTEIASGALVFKDVSWSKRALSAARDILAYAGEGPGTERPAPHIGSAARMFETRHTYVSGLGDAAGVAIAWRSGPVLGLIFVGGLTERQDRRIAVSLALRQQQRLAHPRPLPPDVDDDRTVWLDNPHRDLGVPVYWLGLSLRAPSRGLPPLTLESAGPGGPGSAVYMTYTGPRHRSGVTIDLWKPSAWRSFAQTRLGRLVWASPCAKSTTTPFPGGHAVIYAGYGEELGHGCPARPPDRYMAHVFTRGVVATVDMVEGLCCAAVPSGEPYNSENGMRAIAGALRVRKSASTRAR